VDGGAPPDLSAGGGRISERSAGCGVGAAGAADPQGVTGRATTRDGHAGGDETPFFICCAPAVRGATYRTTAFRTARRSTTSSASSKARGPGRRFGPSCTWRRVSGWVARPAHQLPFSTARPARDAVPPVDRYTDTTGWRAGMCGVREDCGCGPVIITSEFPLPSIISSQLSRYKECPGQDNRLPGTAIPRQKDQKS